MNFVKWASRSLVGHVVFLELIFALPFFVWGVVMNYTQGTLTLAFLISMLIEIGAVGAAMGVAGWYLFTQPLIRRKKK